VACYTFHSQVAEQGYHSKERKLTSGQSQPPDVVRSLHQDLVPFLQTLRDPDDLGRALERLAAAVRADAAILWGADGDSLGVLHSCGAVPGEWLRSNAPYCAGMKAFREGQGVLSQGGGDVYGREATGLAIGQVLGLPVQSGKGTLGAIEVWWAAGRLRPEEIQAAYLPLEEAVNATLPPLVGLETERRNYVSAISRLMMLYDIGKVFHSTLELSELTEVIISRVANILEAESAALWLFDPVKKNLVCAQAIGPRAGQLVSARLETGDAGLGAAASNSEAVMLHDVTDMVWTGRWGSPVPSILAIPLIGGGKLVGAVEVVRGADAPRFTDEDLHLLIDVGKQGCIALRNAQRLQAERRVNELNALMEISKEITATLDLDRVLSTAVNRVTSVIPCDRCSVALQRKGRWELHAVSGEMKVDRSAAAMQALEAMHVWLAGSGGDCIVIETEEGIEAEREETREKFSGYFESSGVSAFFGFLLKDEEGSVGTLVLEARDSAAMTHSHADLARIFVSQLTVAVRNAMLYSQMPLAGVLQPLAEKKARLAAIPAVRRSLLFAGAAALLAFLIFFPWQSKPSGDAKVLPARILPVSTQVAGVVGRVLVQEGAQVEAGQVLAELVGEEQRVELERAQSEYEILSRRILQLEASGDLGSARLERSRLQQVAAQRDFYRLRLAKTQLTSPIAGVVITPRMEERAGQLLKPGDVLCQVVDLQRAWVELAIPEMDIGQVQAGQQAWVKLNTYPTRRYDGQVLRVSPQGREQGDIRVFDVVVEVPNPDQTLRAGMLGRGKVLGERAPVGYLLLRPVGRWIWLKVWSWLP
jgi:RND family efflux transporter MFP subunit